MQRNNKKLHPQLILLTLVFIFPMLLSWFLYHYHQYFQLNTTNHGIFIKPPITLPFLIPQNYSAKTWKIIYVTDNHCDATCQKINNQLHQVQKALGQESHRVSLMLINQKTLPKTISSYNKIFLADPMGHLFMYYPNTTDPINILKDLKRVLEVSQIG